MDQKTAICLALTVVAIIAVIIVLKDKLYVFTGEEDFTAGLSTTTGLSYYNKNRMCFPANAMGSSDAFCTTSGYVLF
jgi:hypothetical protein